MLWGTELLWAHFSPKLLRCSIFGIFAMHWLGSALNGPQMLISREVVQSCCTHCPAFIDCSQHRTSTHDHIIPCMLMPTFWYMACRPCIHWRSDHSDSCTTLNCTLVSSILEHLHWQKDTEHKWALDNEIASGYMLVRWFDDFRWIWGVGKNNTVYKH